MIYGEDKRYFCLFKPIIDALEKLKYPYSFYTSDEADPMLEHKSDIAEIKFIGKGTKAATILNTLQADICLLTTPQLDVLEIKRSKGVKHYCHILHSMGHIELYEIFALDYFDSVFTNSPIHTDFIREVEKVRGLKAKQIEIIGCPYLDYLHDKLDTLPQINPSHKTTTILLAPSWGRESILEKYGLKLLKPLLDTGYNVIIRPHPQSYISQKSILDNLTQTLKSYSNLKWDNNADNIYAMAESDLMIGDFSGVLFDYICLFNKPLLTMEFAFNSIGYDLEDTSYKDNTWKDKALKDISQTIREQDFINIKSIIDSALNDTSKFQNRLKYKELLWHHAHQGGMQTALKLLSIHKSILEEGLGEFIEVHNVINAIDSIIDSSNPSTLPVFASETKQSTLYINSNQNAESLKDSNDSAECLKDSSAINCHNLTSPSLATTPLLRHCEHSQNVKQSAPLYRHCEALQKPKQSICVSIESNAESSENNPVIANIECKKNSNDFIDFSEKMDCHENPCGFSRNDAVGTTLRKTLQSRNDSSTSSLRGSEVSEAIHSKNNPHEVQPNLAPLRGSEIEKKGGSSASALLELECENSEALPLKAKKRSFLARRGSGEEGAALFAKKSDYINETNLTESRRIERAESAESLKDSTDSMESSEKMDLQVWVSCLRNARHEFNRLNSRNDELKTTAYKNTISRNDENNTDSSKLQSDSNNNKRRVNPHEAKSRNNEIDLDCHDSTTQNLTMTAKGNSINANNLAESRRIERAESAESLKDSTDSMKSSEKMDLQVWVSCLRNARHENPCGFSRNDELKTTAYKNTISRNDDSMLDCHDSTQSIKDSTPHTKDSINE